MKVFQTLHKYEPYIPYFEKKYAVESMSYEAHRQTLIKDRFYALHLLKPTLDLADNGFYTIWDYENLQVKWAIEKGWKERDLKKILFAQIEDYQPDVFYNMSPTFFKKEELDASLKNSVKRICWSASPYYDNELFKLYETRLTNLPTDVLPKSQVGFRTDLFQPAFDPAMESYAQNQNRPIDLFFYGQYAENIFKRRNEHIDRLLAFKHASPDLNIKIRLQYRTIKQPIVNIPYIRRFLQKTVFPPQSVLEFCDIPTYGLDLYRDVSQSKIVFNAGVDFSGEHKVNMRNFEVLGCGALMISDQGIYPAGFEMNRHFSTYNNIEDCIHKIKELLQDNSTRQSIAQVGHEMVKTTYTKETQWQLFQKIAASL